MLVVSMVFVKDEVSPVPVHEDDSAGADVLLNIVTDLTIVPPLGGVLAQSVCEGFGIGFVTPRFLSEDGPVVYQSPIGPHLEWVEVLDRDRPNGTPPQMDGHFLILHFIHIEPFKEGIEAHRLEDLYVASFSPHRPTPMGVILPATEQMVGIDGDPFRFEYRLTHD